jgi:anti-sigma factor RsiW
MTLNSDTPNHDYPSNDRQENQAIDTDRFELLSAYLDGELTPEERHQVQYWLDTDPQFKQIYRRLLRLHQGMQNVNASRNNVSTEQLCDRIFLQVDRQQKRRKFKVVTGGTIAALFAASVFGFWTNGNWLLQQAKLDRSTLNVAKSSQDKSASKPLMVAVTLDKPAVNIPKLSK